MKHDKSFFCFLVLLALNPAPLFACTCAGPGPACSEAVSPDVAAIFLGTVERIKPDSSGQIEVLFSVMEPFKGGTVKTETIETANGESACGFTFHQGEQYLVYARKRAGELVTSVCDRTRNAAAAAGDLEFLRKMNTMPNSSEIFGTYKRYDLSVSDASGQKKMVVSPMTGRRITLWRDRTSRDAVVDATGSFRFSGLQPGKYNIKASAPPGFSEPDGSAYVSRPPYDLSAIEVLPKGCAQVDFITRPDGHIAGQVIDSEGRPLSNVEVRVWSKVRPFQFQPGYIQSVKNNPDGTFDIGLLPPGQYLVGAFVWNLPQGFPSRAEDGARLTTATLRFFPEDATLEQARPITVKLGQRIGSVEIKIPFNASEWKDVR
jgi:hypothetical protein